MAATEAEKQNLIENTYRRASLTIDGEPKIEVDRIAGILGQMGQSFDQEKLARWIKMLDPKNSGYLNHENYNKLCKEFVEDPAVLAKFAGGDEFSFKHLINLGDFASP